MTTKLEKIRKAFEAQFPVPEGVIFEANPDRKTGGYIHNRKIHSPGSIPRADEYGRYWSGFVAAWNACQKTPKGLMITKKNKVAEATWLERFQAAVAILCKGNVPPVALCEDWLNPASDGSKLQQFAIEYSGLPWMQGVEILDAAHSLAKNPREGEGHTPQHDWMPDHKSPKV